jgi:hypothetical protein
VAIAIRVKPFVDLFSVTIYGSKYGDKNVLETVNYLKFGTFDLKISSRALLILFP